METLDRLQIGQNASVTEVVGDDAFRRRLLEMGLAPGVSVQVIRRAPLGDPLEIAVRGYRLSLRQSDATRILLDTAHIAVPAPRSSVDRPDVSPYRRPGAKDKPYTITIAGNPNTGKSTLFSRLTGLDARIANYPGTTIDLAHGRLSLTPELDAELVDIPGTYSLTARSSEEQIAIDELLGRRTGQLPDAAVVLLNATALERSLYLLLQVIELHIPTIAVVNMLDEAQERGIEVDVDGISAHFGVPCIGAIARRGIGIPELKQALIDVVEGRRDATPGWHWSPPSPLDVELNGLGEHLEEQDAPQERKHAFALWALMSVSDDDDLRGVTPELRAAVRESRQRLQQGGFDTDLEVTQSRYRHIDEDAQRFIRRPASERPSWNNRLDNLLTHPVGGLLIFVALMGLVFTAIFDWAAPLMDLIDGGFNAASQRVGAMLGDGFFSRLLAEGILKGVGAVLVFLPQIAILLTATTLMEATGYMARAAFMIDRLMRRLGLNGKAFVPMLSGFACAVPAILATRTIENRRDRVITMMAIPLISCSARLPVYTLLIATLLPAEKQTWGPLSLGTLVMIGIYLLSTAFALAAAGVLSKTLFRGRSPELLIELPPYRAPIWRLVFILVGRKVKAFLKTAGTVIVTASVILWALLSYPKPDSLSRNYRAEIAATKDSDQARALRNAEQAELLEQSYGGRLGKTLEPLIKPLGFDWRIGIGLVGSFAAREVFVATMGIVYGVGEADEQSTTLRQAIRQARRPDGTPLYTPLTALSLIVFFMIAMQCVSTLAIARHEARNWRVPLFMLVYLTVFAYLASLATFQIGRLLGFD